MTAFLILHVAPDHDAVTILGARLEEAGISHKLVDVERRLGRAQRQQLRQRILAAQAVVVVISTASADADALLREVEFARQIKGDDTPIIPLVIGPSTAGSPFDGMPVDAVVVNELRSLDAVNARDGSDPLPPLRRFLAPASSYPNGYLFISYSTPNRAIVEAYAQGLRDNHNIDAWWFEGRQRAGIIAFSRGYAPPEQLRGAPPQAQTDIYSLAVVLWELLTGRRLFDGTWPRSSGCSAKRRSPW